MVGCGGYVTDGAMGGAACAGGACTRVSALATTSDLQQGRQLSGSWSRRRVGAHRDCRAGAGGAGGSGTGTGVASFSASFFPKSYTWPAPRDMPRG